MVAGAGVSGTDGGCASGVAVGAAVRVPAGGSNAGRAGGGRGDAAGAVDADGADGDGTRGEELADRTAGLMAEVSPEGDVEVLALHVEYVRRRRRRKGGERSRPRCGATSPDEEES